MKMFYFLKKGFQFYPPCLAQILMLNDLGVELEVYHGKNSDFINQLLDKRKIKHHELFSDSLKNGKLQSVKKILNYRYEAKKIIKSIPDSEILWFGNCESIMTLGNILEGRRFVASILELYDDQKWIDHLLLNILPKAEAIICCEKHRAAIMKSRYHLKKPPYVMPNKPYEIEESEKKHGEYSKVDPEIYKIMDECKQKSIVLYQGIISKDRPLSNIARALAEINDENVVFWIMGKGDEQVVDEAKGIYKNTIYLGYVPSPQHLIVTQAAHIGIANYDFSNLNNVFCAPNKIYEYAKFGLPMLTSDNVGLVETVGAACAASCVDFSCIDDIVRGIKKILENEQLYRKNAQKFYAATDNMQIMKQICEELEQL